ncbi:hypothetical protein EW026_g7428 [Hermanssonia centrifuga]|uniref:Protein kinase domain-containing protein n=1 Tax=Hermanssonia centrifuga TaxID=98765 RepID=A0A4V3X9F1_9APHY|nr:hypothetical protein EW026_g7428 [Hermanssonia centrifuga]
MNTSHIQISSRVKATVHPYVKQDLANAKYIPLYAWTETVLGLSQKDLEERAAHIRQLKWFEDTEIRQAMVAFCTTPHGESHEKGRYGPFAAIVNRAFELAKGNLPGVPNSYPIDDICVVRNDPHDILCIPEHGKLGAERSPDLLFLRAEPARKLLASKAKRVRWIDVLGWIEFKASKKNLLRILNDRRKEYGLGVIDEGTWESRESTPEPYLDLALDGAEIETSVVPTVGRKHARDVEDDENDYSDPTGGPSSGSSAKKLKTTHSPTDGRTDAKIQSGGYALETAACTYGTRSFCIGIVFDNDKMSLWFYDAAGYISITTTLSLLADFEKVLSIFVGFACLGPEGWGAMPSVLSPPSQSPAHFPRASLENHTFTLPRKGRSNVRVTLTKPVFTQYSLVGRRTFVYDIRTSSVVSKEPLVVKLSYQVASRKAEQDLLALAKKAKVEHLPEVHLWGDLWKMSDGIRQIFYDRSSAMSANEDEIASYEERTLRALVCTKYLPLKGLFAKSWKMIPEMVFQMLDCLHDLRYKAHILHRDLSCNNVMYEVRNGKVCFILNDFDLATVVTDEGEPSAVASSKHRTGTLPFMAYELLKDMTRSNKNGSGPRVMHRLRHELESLLYVTIWSTVATPDAEGKKTEFVDYLRTWEMGTVKSVEKLKWSLCSDPDEVNDIPLPLAVEPLREVFIRWFAILRRAYTKWNEIRYPEESQVSISLQEDFDVETLDGMITRDTVYKAVTEGLVAAGLAECIRTKASDGAILNAENDSRDAKANGNKSSGNKANTETESSQSPRPAEKQSRQIIAKNTFKYRE